MYFIYISFTNLLYAITFSKLHIHVRLIGLSGAVILFASRYFYVVVASAH